MLPQSWGLEIDDPQLRLLRGRLLDRLAANRASLIASARLSASGLQKLDAIAIRNGITVLDPMPVRDAAAGTTACVQLKRAAPGSRCAVGMASRARSDALSASADMVAVRVKRAKDFRRLSRSAGTSRIVGILAISKRSYRRAQLRRAIRVAARRADLDIVVRPTGTDSGSIATRFVALASAAAGDTVAPSRPANLRVSARTPNSVTVAWSASSDDTRVMGYAVYADGVYVDTVTATAYRFRKLDCESHLLEVDAYDQAGNRSAKSYVTAAPTGCDDPPELPGDPGEPIPPPGCGSTCPDTTAPSSPTGLRTSVVGPTALTFAWDPATDDRAVTGYRLYLDGSPVRTTTGTSATVSSLTCGTRHQAGLEALDGAGNVSTRATIQATTAPCPDTTAPSTPQGVSAQAASQTSVTLGWNAATDNVAVMGYRVLRDGALVGTTTTTSYAAAGLSCGRSYSFAVEAIDAAGNRSGRGTVTASTAPCAPVADTTPPSVPQGMAWNGKTRTTLGLRWEAATDNVGVAGYHLYRNGTRVASTTSLAYDYTGLTCGTSYTVALEAYDAAGNVSNRAEASGSTTTEACSPAPDTQAPTAPGSPAKTGGTQTSVALGWTASTDNVGVTGYRVYRNGTLVASPAGTSHNVTGLACGTAYSFGIEAVDAASNVSARSAVSAATSACAPAPDTQAPSVPGGMVFGATTQTSIALAWNASTDNVGVAGYRVFRDGQSVGTTTNRSYTFSGLSCGQTYSFAVEAYDAAGNASNRSQASGSATTTTCDTGPDPEPGNATRFVSTGGSDSGSCTQAAPCRSFARAAQVASPGEVVQVAGGTYGDQQFNAIAGRSGPNVHFRPAAGARVVLAGLGFGGSEASQGPDFITVEGMVLVTRGSEPGAGNQEGIWIGPGSTNITLIDMDAGSVNTWFADRVTVKGGDYGPCHAVWGSSNICGNTKFDVSTNVLVDGATFHDYRFDETCFTVAGADCHWECMYINGSQNVTIRNSKFRQCAIFDIFATISGPDAGRLGHDGLLIENNWFGAPYTESLGGGSPSRPTAVSLAWCQNSSKGYKNTTVRFNSFARNTQLQIDPNPSCVFDNIKVVGNISMWDGCQSRWSWQYNVWSTAWRTGSCGSTDKILGATLPYVDGSSLPTMDYHLTGGATVADNLVPVSAGCPATDIDGQPRGANGFCDAGSDERP